ncbi:hypothetical protein ACH5RR_036706 [Cinchona calisaya]|uniref:Uncharacterized protein n=1 Tax=Cinchona calisaya TaxID=153742 RepID=A0ABD2Y3Z2_9GENT
MCLGRILRNMCRNQGRRSSVYEWIFAPGSAFSLSKLEFTAAYHRLRGANVLLPFAFQCTGMPIKASADKLLREIEMFGNPPIFPVVKEEESVEAEVRTEGESEGNQTAAGGKFKGKKSKAVAKSGVAKFQWEIMQSYGLTDESQTLQTLITG